MEIYEDDCTSSGLPLDPIGVLDLPPSISVPSIMLRGENGVVRWITVTGGKRRIEGKQNTTGHINKYYNTADNDSEGLLSEDDDESLIHSDINAGRLMYSARSLKRSTWLNENIYRLKEEANAALLLSQQIQEAKDAKKYDDGGSFSNHQYCRQLGALQWTAKYTPNSFVELLSDENSNLFLLRWIKAWDAHVFRHKGTIKGVAPKDKSKDYSHSIQGNENSTTHASESDPKDDKRPRQRIVLIVGPPGAGKTTMAHVVAKHCGYDVVEINASVDRSVSTLERLISSSVQDMHFQSTGALMGEGSSSASSIKIREAGLYTGLTANLQSRSDIGVTKDIIHSQHSKTSADTPLTIKGALMSNPKALIIDEMDGVLSSVVPLLLRQDIHRPVICIANDLYAPALREMRQRNGRDVVVMNLPPIDSQRLLARLKVIVLKEQEIREELRSKYKRDMDALSRRKDRSNEHKHINHLPIPMLEIQTPLLADIVHASNGDVRTSLNTLQFLCTSTNSSSYHCQNSKKKNETTTNINLMFKELCQKDSTMSVWATWQHLFQKKEKRKYIQLLESEEGTMNSSQKEDEEIAVLGSTALQGYGKDEYERNIYRENHRKCSEKLKMYNSDTLPTSHKTVPLMTEDVVGINDKPLIQTWWTGRNRLPSDISSCSIVDPGFAYLHNHILPYCSNMSLLLEGAYESYPKQRYTDYSLGKTVHCASTYSLLDTFETVAYSSSSIGSLSMFQLVEQYRIVTAASVFLNCSSLSRMEKVTFPTVESVYKSKVRASEIICKSFTVSHKFIPSRLLSIWGHVSPWVFVEDVAPLLCRCLLPPHYIKFPSLSFQSAQVLTGRDRDNFVAVVERHARYGLTYVPSAGGIDNNNNNNSDQGVSYHSERSSNQHNKYKDAPVKGTHWSPTAPITEYYALEPAIDTLCFSNRQHGEKRKGHTNNNNNNNNNNSNNNNRVESEVLRTTNRALIIRRSDVRQLMSCEISLSQLRLLKTITSNNNNINNNNTNNNNTNVKREESDQKLRPNSSVINSNTCKDSNNNSNNNNVKSCSDHTLLSSNKSLREVLTTPINSAGIHTDEHNNNNKNTVYNNSNKGENLLKKEIKVKKDFFGRVINTNPNAVTDFSSNNNKKKGFSSDTNTKSDDNNNNNNAQRSTLQHNTNTITIDEGKTSSSSSHYNYNYSMPSQLLYPSAVKYTYFHGCTTGIKRTATLEDFLS